MYQLRSHHEVIPRRLASVTAIVAVAVVLGYLRFAPGPAPLTVPAGAHAGDLTLNSCTYTTESGDYAADCGTLVVAENPAKPASRLIALPIIRIKATSTKPGEPVFYLEGGPGLSNMTFRQVSRFAADRDVVLVGYRGIDGSVRLDCPEVSSAVKRSTDLLGEESFRAYGDAYRACADRLKSEGLDVSMYGLPRQVEDFEAARVALGYDRIDLLSQSAGTRTAMIYAWRFPERIHRSVMIGVNPPGHFLYADAQTMDELIGRYAELCANNAICSARTEDLSASMAHTRANMPGRWLFLPIKSSNVRVVTFFGLPDSTPMVAPPSAPLTLDAWLSAADGDASGLWLQSLAGDLFPWPFVWGQYAAAAILDAQAARDYFSAADQDHSTLAWDGSAFSWGGGQLADAWPAGPDDDAYSRVRISGVETLLISGALDTATPPQFATRELLPYLSNGHQVVLPGFGHITSFFTQQPEAGTRLINTYLATGHVDNALYGPQEVDFTPGTTLTSIAKIVAGVMLGLALLTVLSLLWMARRIHQRGQFGYLFSAVLRSLYAFVLGLGGWFLGSLIVLVITPAIRVDDQLLIVVSAGVPIALAIYFAWVHRDWPANAKATGFAAAAAGALAGAWFGVNVTAGLLAAITAILGATLGANAIVLALDTWGEHPVVAPERREVQRAAHRLRREAALHGFTPQVTQRNSAGVSLPSAPGAVNVVVTYTPVPAGATAPKSGLISIGVGDNYFSPEEVHVTVGSTVEWDYSGGGAETESIHNVVGGSFNSGDLNPNSKYAYTFEQPGEFDYVCTYHAKQMTGKVFVQ